MYSGITKGLFEVIAVTQKPGLLNYTVNLTPTLCDNLNLGDSIAVDGVCQTVTHIHGTQVSFQAMQETLDKTTLKLLKLGSVVSIERSLRVGDDLGGHEVSGHVVGTGFVYSKIATENNLKLVIQCNPTWMKYILPKGFIAVDGSSLTVGETCPERGQFTLHLIPETLRLTHFAHKKEQDQVNIELDHKTKTIVDTVERVLSSMKLC